MEEHDAGYPVTGTPEGLGDPKPERPDTRPHHGVRRRDLHDFSCSNAQSS